jgi:hypothetical protein
MEFNFLKELAALPEKTAVVATFILFVVPSIKGFGVSGVWLTRASFGLGLVIGVVAQIATSFPDGFAAWVFAAFFGLFCGVIATGAYTIGDRWFGKKDNDK